MTDYTIAVVKDAICLLDSFIHSPNGLTLTELIEATGLGKNKVFRLLSTLEQLRMVYRDEHSRFRLGLHVLELSQNVHIHDLLIDVCSQIMDELLRETQESIFLGVVAGTNALCIATRESNRSMRLFARVGIQSPLYKGGVPKVLLANMNSNEQNRLLHYFENTVSTPEKAVDWQAFRNKLAQIARQGYSITVDELDVGAHSITAPIFDAQGRVIAAMSIAGPSVRFPDETIGHYIELITSTTRRISEKLGYNISNQEAKQEILSKFI